MLPVWNTNYNSNAILSGASLSHTGLLHKVLLVFMVSTVSTMPTSKLKIKGGAHRVAYYTPDCDEKQDRSQQLSDTQFLSQLQWKVDIVVRSEVIPNIGKNIKKILEKIFCKPKCL